MTPDTLLRGWCLALRDLCDLGALTASVTLEGCEEPVTITYTSGKGARVVAGERRVEVPDEALDYVGLVPAEQAVVASCCPSKAFVSAGRENGREWLHR